MQASIKVLTVVFLIVLLIVVSTIAFIGAGYVLHLALPLTLFQASILCIGATLVAAFIILALSISQYLSSNYYNNEYYDEDDDDYEDDDDDDDDDDDYEFRRKFNKKLTVINTSKLGRNEPCPCGSGKKYKHCCGK